VPGLHGAMPDLGDLDNGDLKHDIDFRQVYATVLREWFKTEPEPILHRPFASLPLIG
jgi:hypothetical protein